MAIPETRSSPPPILARAQSPLSDLLAAFDAVKQVGITHTNRIPTGEYVATQENMNESPYDRLMNPVRLGE